MSETPGPVLSGAQRALYEALARLHTTLADMYYGALLVFAQTDNPDHLAQAAHSLRELMEKLPRHVNVPLDRKGSSMTERVRKLQAKWIKLSNEGKRDGKSLKAGSEIGEGLESFLDCAKEFFAWVEIERPSRKNRTAKVVRSLDPVTRPLPAAIEDLRIKEWETCHDYLENVSHHTWSAEELDRWISALERYLLDKLCPRTFEDHAALDAIIKKGEQG
jgi:hypothetical protein